MTTFILGVLAGVVTYIITTSVIERNDYGKK